MKSGLDAVKAATWDLHVKAERGGIVTEILAGRATRSAVALLLRNLLPVYQILDASEFARPALRRSTAIEADLRTLSPNNEVPLLPEGVAYADRLRSAGAGLVAHAYVRYLGDLNGGQILQRRFATSLGSRLAFHDFPLLVDQVAFTAAYRADLNQAVQAIGVDLVAAETRIAFEMNIALSEAVQTIILGQSA